LIFSKVKYFNKLSSVSSQLEKFTSIADLLLDDNKSLRGMLIRRDKETYAVLQQASLTREDALKSSKDEVLLLRSELHKALELVSRVQTEKQAQEGLIERQQSEIRDLRASLEQISLGFADMDAQARHLTEQKKFIEPRYEEFRRQASEREVEAALLREKLENESRSLRLATQKLKDIELRNQKLASEKEDTAGAHFSSQKHFDQLIEDRNKLFFESKLEIDRLKQHVV
jgi:hypothetical protein